MRGRRRLLLVSRLNDFARLLEWKVAPGKHGIACSCLAISVQLLWRRVVSYMQTRLRLSRQQVIPLAILVSKNALTRGQAPTATHDDIILLLPYPLHVVLFAGA